MSVPVTNSALVPPGVSGPSPATAPSSTSPTALSGPSFADVLRSARAPQRRCGSRVTRSSGCSQRGIQLSQAALGRLTDGVSRAAGKGSRDSVVFVDGTAFVVSVTNNTVITAVGSEHMQQHVFTNIDSAVIA